MESLRHEMETSKATPLKMAVMIEQEPKMTLDFDDGAASGVTEPRNGDSKGDLLKMVATAEQEPLQA